MCDAAPGQSGTAASASLEIVDACGPCAKGALPRYTQLYPATNLPSIFPAVPHAFALSLLRHTPRRRARIPRRRRVQPASGFLARARPYRRFAGPSGSRRISVRLGRLRFCAVPLTLRRFLMFLCHTAPLMHWMLPAMRRSHPLRDCYETDSMSGGCSASYPVARAERRCPCCTRKLVPRHVL